MATFLDNKVDVFGNFLNNPISIFQTNDRDKPLWLKEVLSSGLSIKYKHAKIKRFSNNNQLESGINQKFRKYGGGVVILNLSNRTFLMLENYSKYKFFFRQDTIKIIYEKIRFQGLRVVDARYFPGGEEGYKRRLLHITEIKKMIKLGKLDSFSLTKYIEKNLRDKDDWRYVEDAVQKQMDSYGNTILNDAIILVERFL